jgi:outer membrane protein OmpA-like peptidoglycan-associated protein
MASTAKFSVFRFSRFKSKPRLHTVYTILAQAFVVAFVIAAFDQPSNAQTIVLGKPGGDPVIVNLSVLDDLDRGANKAKGLLFPGSSPRDAGRITLYPPGQMPRAKLIKPQRKARKTIKTARKAPRKTTRKPAKRKTKKAAPKIAVAPPRKVTPPPKMPKMANLPPPPPPPPALPKRKSVSAPKAAPITAPKLVGRKKTATLADTPPVTPAPRTNVTSKALISKPIVKQPKPAPKMAAPKMAAPKVSAPKMVTPKQTASLPKSVSSHRLAFSAGSASLPKKSVPELKAIVQAMKKDNALRLQLRAYAKGGEDKSSQARRLSLSRALAVRSFLIKEGVRSTRIDVRALGDKVPSGPPDRVDLSVIAR